MIPDTFSGNCECGTVVFYVDGTSGMAIFAVDNTYVDSTFRIAIT